MKTISPAFLAHLQSGDGRLATLIKITPRTGTPICLTDHDTDITFQGNTYQSVPGIETTAIRSESGGSVDNLSVSGVLHDSGIPRDELVSGKYNNSTITVYRVNYTDPDNQYMVDRVATIGEIEIGDHAYEIELLGLIDHLQYEVGDLISPGCRAVLGDSRCTVDIQGYTEYGVVISASSRKEFVAEILERHPGGGHTAGYNNTGGNWFTFGLVIWDSSITGAFNHATDGKQYNDGLQEEVQKYDYLSLENRFTLFHAMPYDVQPGDKFKVVAGCDKKKSTCKAVFSNVINFQGEPDLPGEDRVTVNKPVKKK